MPARRSIAALAFALLAAGSARADELRVLAFNVLAPIWASPSYLDGMPWEPNGTALAMRSGTFRSLQLVDLALGDGNHATLAHVVHAATGRSMRIASVHLDSDHTSSRRAELLAVLAAMPPDPDAVDVICGDFNEDTITGTVAGISKRAGFADVLASVDNREATHPFTSSYNQAQRWAIIDHVLVRGATPLAGDVFNFGVWAIDDDTLRIAENLRQCGSDHFPIDATIAF